MKKKLLLTVLFVLALTCLLLTACGGGDDVTTAPTTTAPVTPATTTAPTTTAPITLPPVTTAPVTTLPPVTANSPVFTGAVYTYDGEPHSIQVGDLPDGVAVKYSVNGGAPVDAVSEVAAGVYHIVASFTVPEGMPQYPNLSAVMVIDTAPAISIGTFAVTGGTFAYDGAYHLPTVSGELPASLGYRFSEGEPVRDAGMASSYVVTFYYKDPVEAASRQAPAPLTGIIVSVTKADIDMSGIRFDNATVPYDGAYHSPSNEAALQIKGELSSLLDVTYTGGAREKGDATMTATFSFKNPNDANNYNLPAPMTATLTVGLTEFDLTYANFVDQTVYYNGLDQTPQIKVENLLVEYEVKQIVEGFGEVPASYGVMYPGVYKVYAYFSVAEGLEGQYSVPEDMAITVTVEKAVLNGLDLPEWEIGSGWVTVGNDGYFPYAEGTEYGVTLVEPAAWADYRTGGGVLTATVTNNKATATGVYAAHVEITLDHPYYVLPEGYGIPDFEWQIADKQIDLSGATYGDETLVYDEKGHKLALAFPENAIPEGYVGYEVKVFAANGKQIALPEEGFKNCGTYTFRFAILANESLGYAPVIVEKTLTITPATIDPSLITLGWIDGTATEEKEIADNVLFLHDGTTKSVKLSAATIEALKQAGISYSITNNAKTAVGEYTATITFRCDSNHVIAEGKDSATFRFNIAYSESWTEPEK